MRYRMSRNASDKEALSHNPLTKGSPMAVTATPRKRRKREYEDDDFAKACGRMVNALERRAAVNPDALAYLLTLRAELDGAITRSGHALSKQGGGQFSLGELAEFMTFNGHKMSRQAAQQRWGKSAAIKLGTITERINNVVRLDAWRARRASAKAAGRAEATEARAV